MWDKFTDKFFDNFGTILLGLLFVFVAGTFYNLGSESAKNKICKQVGGVYVQTYHGYKCIHGSEIEL
jgi:hypothetical protein